MLKLKFILIISTLNFITQGQVVKYSDKKQRLFFCMSNSPREFGKILKSAGIRNCIYFTGKDIDPGKKNKLNTENFTKALNKLVPDKNYSGILILDWEDSLYHILKYDIDINNERYEKAIDEFINVIQFAKQERPKAQWAYWDIPMSIYWVKVDTLWKKRYDKLNRLLENVDILVPHLYDYFPPKIRSKEEDEAYIKEILTKTLEKAYKLKKPVLPFIWHRYSDAIPETSLKQIEEGDFKDQLQLMKNVSFKGKKINGIIWWQEDLYFINIKEPHIMLEIGDKSINEYRDQVLLKYYRWATDFFIDRDN